MKKIIAKSSISNSKSVGVDPINPRVRKETELAYLRINNPASAQRLWERHFTAKDRARLGNDLEKAWSQHGETVGMFMKARRVDQVDAIIEVATLLGFLRDQDRDWLTREWGLPANATTTDKRPVWRPDVGKLYWGREVIRSIRLFQKKPSNLQILMEEFDAENWPEVINSPFQFAAHLNDALRILNKGLTRIKFFAIDGAMKCRWDEVSPRSHRH